ncbi:uncharacterized protein [Littorina saxatilis]|uniref:Uncharacterized protein n=1 Tax=Littorina saxatilis TaxID=31220 RepID=A0AAN9G7Z4_9CAEN
MVLRSARHFMASTAIIGVVYLFLMFTDYQHNTHRDHLAATHQHYFDVGGLRERGMERGGLRPRGMESEPGDHGRKSVHGDNSGKLVEPETGNDGKHHETGSTSSSRALMRILILTYKRDRSLRRCLDSINNAEYDGEKVEVEIYIDRGKDGKVHKETFLVANSFRFNHGPVRVHVQPRHVGVLGQWLGTWRVPRENSSEIAVFVEDDITVSPYFARWLRLVHKKYGSYPGINGYTLQAESIRHATGVLKASLTGPPGEIVFLYPVLGSWGFSPNVGAWRDFLRWYNQSTTLQSTTLQSIIPFVSGLKPSQWYLDLHKAGRAESMWTMWHIAHAYTRKLYTVYPNLPEGKALAINWKEPGEHYFHAATGEGLRAHLLDTWHAEDLRLPEQLSVLDAKGEITGQMLSPTGLY